MKKALFAIVLLLHCPPTLPAEIPVTVQQIAAEGIRQINLNLPQGCEIKYDELQTKSDANGFEITLTNPREVSCGWTHEGALTIGYRAVDNLYWSQLEGTSRITAENCVLTSTIPVRFTFQTDGAVVPMDVLTWSLSPEKVLQAFKKDELVLGKGQITYHGEAPVTLVDLEETRLSVEKVSSDNTKINVLVKNSVKNLNFPDLTRQTLTALTGTLCPELLYYPAELGPISFSVVAPITLPSVKAWEEFKVLDEKKQFGEICRRLGEAGYGFELAVNNWSNPYAHGEALYKVYAEIEKGDPRFNALLNARQTFSERHHELLKHAVSQAIESNTQLSEGQRAFLKKNRDAIMALLPNLATSGEIRTHANLSIDMEAESELPKATAFLVSNSTEKPGCDWKIEGAVRGLDEFRLNNNYSAMSGKLDLSVKRYKDGIDRACAFYNAIAALGAEVFPDKNIQSISSEQREYAKRYLHFISNTPNEDGEDLEITVDYTDSANPKIGTRPLFMALMGPQPSS